MYTVIVIYADLKVVIDTFDVFDDAADFIATEIKLTKNTLIHVSIESDVKIN
jgi:hypothetical protein